MIDIMIGLGYFSCAKDELNYDDLRDYIKTALVDLASEDADFNGQNGKDYLWHEAKRAGYLSNAEYLAETITLKHENKLKRIQNFDAFEIEGNEILEKILADYIQVWIEDDPYYNAVNWHVNFTIYDNYFTVILSVCYCHG